MLKRLNLNIRPRWLEWTTFFVYCAAVSFAIPYHEPWADEAQAWQLARNLSLSDLFQTYIRYEGSPGLWHFLLWIFIRAHITYTGMHWICGAIAAAATALLIFKSPLPRYLRLVLPFTYFLLFQYAVVARSYVLVPCLLFLIALCWKRSPILLAVLLGLLANVALHASVISGGLAFAYIVDRARIGSPRVPLYRRQFLIASLILLGLWAFAIWTAWPPSDLAQHLALVRGQSRPILLLAFGSLLRAICPSMPISTLFWLAIALCLGFRRSLNYLLPVLLFAAFSGVVHVEWWHMGLLIPLVICLLWITWPVGADEVKVFELVGRGALLGMALVQVSTCIYALNFDHYNAYSPDLAAAQFLRPIVQGGGTVAVTSIDNSEFKNISAELAGRLVGILPYFDRNIFANLPEPFWSWSNRNPTMEKFYQILPSRPAAVVAEIYMPHSGGQIDPHDPNFQLLTSAGYRLTRRFCGTIPLDFRTYDTERSCLLIFQPLENPKELGNTMN